MKCGEQEKWTTTEKNVRRTCTRRRSLGRTGNHSCHEKHSGPLPAGNGSLGSLVSKKWMRNFALYRTRYISWTLSTRIRLMSLSVKTVRILERTVTSVSMEPNSVQRYTTAECPFNTRHHYIGPDSVCDWCIWVFLVCSVHVTDVWQPRLEMFAYECVRMCMYACITGCMRACVRACFIVWHHGTQSLGQVDARKRFTLHPLLDLFNPTPSRLVWEAFSHAAITARRLFVHISTTVCSNVLIQSWVNCGNEIDWRW